MVCAGALRLRFRAKYERIEPPLRRQEPSGGYKCLVEEPSNMKKRYDTIRGELRS